MSISAHLEIGPAETEFLAKQEQGEAGLVWPGVVTGFGAAVAVWISWYVMHLPGMRLSPNAAAPLLLAVLTWAIAAQTRGLGSRAWRVGSVAGFVSALINLLLLGSKLSEQHEAAAGQLVPAAPLITIGFVITSIGIGALGGWLGGSFGSAGLPHRRQPIAWHGRFAWIALATLTPLIAIGGAVTSAGAGMAVPDWPGTYGSNMFLYPIGLMADPYIFLEHTHRLFGTLVGLTTLVLTIAVLVRHGGWLTLAITLPLALIVVGLTLAHNTGETAIATPTLIGVITPITLIAVGCLAWSTFRRSPGAIAASVFSLVCLQGMLGALRVTEISSAYGAAHGVLAQLILCGSAILAVTLSRGWLSYQAPPVQTRAMSGRVAAAAIVAFGALLVQLTLAALFRHTGSSHALWTHVGFSIVAVVAVAVLGFSLRGAERYSVVGRTMNTMGGLLVVCIAVQFVLGFAAWGLLGDAGAGPSRVVMYDALEGAQAPNLARTVVATLHQANGAFLLALTAASWAWGAKMRA